MAFVPERVPYNSCDYRCERCLETGRCRVFSRLDHDPLLRQGDPGEVLAALKASFRETEAMIRQKAREYGIDIDALAGGSLREPDRGAVADPLVYEARQFTNEVRLFLETVDNVPGEMREYLDDLIWHQSVIPMKIHRAVSGKADGPGAEDMKNSAAVAVKSLTICILAFDEIGARVAKTATRCKLLSSRASLLKSAVKARFQLGHSG